LPKAQGTTLKQRIECSILGLAVSDTHSVGDDRKLRYSHVEELGDITG
jgi:hypothetical protein